MSSNSVVSAIDFNLAWTNFCFRQKWFLYYAITGDSGKMDLSILLFFY